MYLRFGRIPAVCVGFAAALLLAVPTAGGQASVPRWSRFERSFLSSRDHPHPIRDAALTVAFTSPRGERLVVPGFWDGGRTWLVRFAPPDAGRWTYETACSDPTDRGLHGQAGVFDVTRPAGGGRFERH